MFQSNKGEEESLNPLRKTIEEKHVSVTIQTLMATVYEYEHIEVLLADRRRDKHAVSDLRQVENKELMALRELQTLVKRMKLEAKEEK